MKIKKTVAFACAATLAAGAAVFAGCGIFGKGRPKTITENGFSVELTTKYDKVSVSGDKDDVLRGNTIICYDSDDIMFSVAQIPREEIDAYHVYDLPDFARYLLEDYYGEDERTQAFKSDDGKLDGLEFAMFYTNSAGYKNVQCDYLFAGAENFYEVSLVAASSDYSKLKDDMDKIVLSCSAEDGLNDTSEVQLKAFDFEDIKICLDDTYTAKEDYYTNGVVQCYPYRSAEGVKILTLDGAENEYASIASMRSWESEDLTTSNGTDFRCAVGAATIDNFDYNIIAAMYIDGNGYAYILEYFIPDYDFADLYFEDVAQFIIGATGSIDDYKTNKPAKSAKTFEDKVVKANKTLGYSINLDDTFVNLGWDDDSEEFALWSAEYDRFIFIAESAATSLSAAKTAWISDRQTGTSRYIETNQFGVDAVGFTYQGYGRDDTKCYEVALFIQKDNRIVVITFGVLLGYFAETPSDSALDNLEEADRLFFNAVKDIAISFE